MYFPPEPPPVKRAASRQERLLGLAVLLVFFVMCFVMSLTLDAQVFNPYNTAHPLTQTAQAVSSQTPTISASESPR